MDIKDYKESAMAESMTSFNHEIKGIVTFAEYNQIVKVDMPEADNGELPDDAPLVTTYYGRKEFASTDIYEGSMEKLDFQMRVQEGWRKFVNAQSYRFRKHGRSSLTNIFNDLTERCMNSKTIVPDVKLGGLRYIDDSKITFRGRDMTIDSSYDPEKVYEYESDLMAQLICNDSKPFCLGLIGYDVSGIFSQTAKELSGAEINHDALKMLWGYLNDGVYIEIIDGKLQAKYPTELNTDKTVSIESIKDAISANNDYVSEVKLRKIVKKMPFQRIALQEIFHNYGHTGIAALLNVPMFLSRIGYYFDCIAVMAGDADLDPYRKFILKTMTTDPEERKKMTTVKDAFLGSKALVSSEAPTRWIYEIYVSVIETAIHELNLVVSDGDITSFRIKVDRTYGENYMHFNKSLKDVCELFYHSQADLWSCDYAE